MIYHHSDTPPPHCQPHSPVRGVEGQGEGRGGGEGMVGEGRTVKDVTSLLKVACMLGEGGRAPDV
jgi:hypothetical protein